MTEHQVVVAGGGPTGLMLAAELALAGVDVVVVERRATQELDGSRAGGLLPRTLEVLDQRGVVERFLAAGQVHPAHGFALVPLPLGDLPTRHPYVLALWQRHIERLLAEWVAELGVPVRRPCDVVGFTEETTGVVVELSDGTALRAAYLVGCDGGRSTVRKAAGIDFVGLDASTSWMIAQVEMDEEPELGFRRDDAGTHAIGRREPGEPIGVVLTEPDPAYAGAPDESELREALVRVYGTDFAVSRVHSLSRFTDMTRQAVAYRRGRVLLAGDAAHVHPPQGGQGLNTGVQDAVNLGWKLARVVSGSCPASLLDTYHDERHPVAARVLRNTMAQVALGRPDERHEALRETVAEVLGMHEPRQRVASMLCALDLCYDLGEGHPMLGRRVPDLEVTTTDGPTRVHALLHAARPVLLHLAEPAGPDLGPWTDRVDLVEGRPGAESCELPVVGEVGVPPAVLVRPDGHVAWVGDGTDAVLEAALESWVGTA